MCVCVCVCVFTCFSGMAGANVLGARYGSKIFAAADIARASSYLSRRSSSSAVKTRESMRSKGIHEAHKHKPSP